MGSFKRAVVTATAASGALFALALPAGAAPAGGPPQLHVGQTISSAFVGPLQFAVSGNKFYVADSFTSTLQLVGSSTPIATGPDPAKGGDLAGVAVDPQTKAIAYTTNNGDHSVTNLTILTPGAKPVVADLSGFERKYNPDHGLKYGTDTKNSCAMNALKQAHIPVSYPGDIDSHAYSVTSLGKGFWAVADAGGNDLLRVNPYGRVSLITTLPAQPVTVTAEFAAQNGLPACVAGIVYKFEAVPTDVEVGPTGDLYATTLPGGPEGPAGGNPGSVYRISYTSKASKVATGFAGATNLAVDAHGGLYVAEISTGTVSKVVAGAPAKVLSLPGVVGLEYANGHLYASTAPAASGASGPGTIVRLDPAV